jgi:ubiquinone/menaquinone biosynthesis C-methylase UbiE
MTTPVEQHFNTIAKEYDHFKSKNWYYYQSLKTLYKELIPENSIVLEIGCGTGDLISQMRAKKAVGIDLSPEMIKVAKKKHPKIQFSAVTIEQYKTDIDFQYIFLADVIEHLENIPRTMEVLSEVAGKNTRVIFTYANPLWEPLLMLLEKLSLKMPEGPHYRIPYRKFEKIFSQYGFKTLEKGWRLPFPAYIPYFSNFINKYICKIPGIRTLCMLEYVVLIKK